MIVRSSNETAAFDPELQVALLLVDRAGVVRHANPTVRSLLGREASRCEGVLLGELLPSAELLEAVRGVSEGQGGRGSLVVRTDAPVRQLLLSLSPVVGLTSEPLVAVQIASLDDRREDREARAALQLRTTIESVISGFAHEVRNPIAAILSITEATLAQLDDGSASASLLSRIPPLVNRVDKLIKQSVRYSRPRLPQRGPHQLRRLIDWSLELAEIEHGSIELEIRLGDDLGPVLVDPEQSEQVLVNLLRNAHDAARSKVALTARREPGTWVGGARSSRVVLEVSDDGPGVPEEHHSRIFEPFFTTKAHGTGLGLAIARDLARLNGGDLELFSTSPSGTTFSLHLEELPQALAEPRGGKTP